MNAEAILKQARAQGATFQVLEQGRLKVQAPSPLPESLMEEVRQHKADILALLAPSNPVHDEDTARLLAWASQAAEAGLTLPEPVRFFEGPLRLRTTSEVGRFCKDQLKYLSMAKSNGAAGGWDRFPPQWWAELEATTIESLAALKAAVDGGEPPA